MSDFPHFTYADYRALCDKLSRAESERDEARRNALRMQAGRDRLSAQVDAVREALEPFLRILRGHSYVPDHVTLDVPMSVLDCARAVLAKLAKGE